MNSDNADAEVTCCGSLSQVRQSSSRSL